MTLESDGASKPTLARPSASLQDGRSRVIRRPRVSNSFRHVQPGDDPKGKGPVSRDAAHRRPHTAAQPRRNSVPLGKTLITATYRENRAPNRKSTPADFAVNYAVPDLYSDIFSTAATLEKETIIGPLNGQAVNLRPKTAGNVQANNGRDAHVSTSPGLQLPHAVPASETHAHPKQENASADYLPPQWGSRIFSTRADDGSSADAAVDTLEGQIETTLTLLPQKNEAELIEPGQETNPIAASAAAMFNNAGRGGGAKSGKSANRKGKGKASESMESELRSLYRNSMAERRLMSARNDLDKRSSADKREYKNMKERLFRQHEELLKCSPSTEAWLNYRKCRTASLQERERENIDKRYSRRARQFRAPPGLKDTVRNIRSLAMYEAGVLDANDPSSRSTISAVLHLKRMAANSNSSLMAQSVVAENGRKGAGIGEENPREGPDRQHVDPTSTLGPPVESPTPTPRKRKSIPGIHGSDLNEINLYEKEDEFKQKETADEAIIPQLEAEVPIGEVLPNQRRLSMADLKSVRNVLHNESGLIASLPLPAPRSSVRARRESSATVASPRFPGVKETPAEGGAEEQEPAEGDGGTGDDGHGDETNGDTGERGNLTDERKSNDEADDHDEERSDNFSDLDAISTDSQGDASDDEAFEKESVKNLTMTI